MWTGNDLQKAIEDYNETMLSEMNSIKQRRQEELQPVTVCLPVASHTELEDALYCSVSDTLSECIT